MTLQIYIIREYIKSLQRQILMQVSSTSAQFTIGGVIFDGSMPSKFRKLLNAKKRQSALQDKEWWICKELTQQDHKEFTSDSWDQIFPFMISAPCKVLMIVKNYKENILMDISKTQFHSLKTLRLSFHNISSIEQLQFMNMSSLQALILNENRISNLNVLNKCGWNSLRNLDIRSNPIQRIEVSRLKILQKDTDQDNKRIDRHIRIQLIGQNESLAAKFSFNYISGSGQSQTNFSAAVKKSIERKCVKFQVVTGK